MSQKPHIVWTFRRTGGTTLASLISSLSPHPTVEHEPFNEGRVFGSVANAYEDGRFDEYEEGIGRIIDKKYVIKNCFEIRTMDFNLDIAARFSEDDAYRHIILLRRSEAKRLLSLAVALETRAWGPRNAEAVIEDLRSKPDASIKLNISRFQIEHQRCQGRLAELQRFFDLRSVPYRVIHFEDIYTGEREERIAELEKLLDFLELGPASPSSVEALFTKAQRSGVIYDYVSNVDQFLTDVTQEPSTIAKIVHHFGTFVRGIRLNVA